MTDHPDAAEPDLSGGMPHSAVLRPGIRTFKPRRSRITHRAEAALTEQAALQIPWSSSPIALDEVWGADVPVVVEIGCGDGRATVAMAGADPGTGVWAIDVHTPGLGTLLADLGAAGIDNVRVSEGDALAILETMVPEHSLAGVRSYFPDPWPKARHHKRRLVQPAILDLVRSRLVPGGFWHLATDWQEYADSMAECFAADRHWEGGTVSRPADRPVTHYEGRALREGRQISDLVFHTIA